MNRSRRLIGITLGVLLVLGSVPAASARTPVDPSTLTPPPPPGATCDEVGRTTVICHTAISFPTFGDPLFDIACGTVYQTGTDNRVGIRWYENGLITRRFYRGALDGTLTLTPDGRGRSIAITGNWINWSAWAVPGDNNTLVQTDYGLEFHATVPGWVARFCSRGRSNSTAPSTASTALTSRWARSARPRSRSSNRCSATDGADVG